MGWMRMGSSKVEYATDQITISKGCPYECEYCWTRLPFFEARASRWKPRPIAEAKRYASMISQRKKIVISFWSEPYCETNRHTTKNVLEILSKSKHTIILLTKNPVIALNDSHIMKKIEDFWFGSTITATIKIPEEPYAPPNPLRIKGLATAHDEGLKTFMSIEPVLPQYAMEVPEIIKTTADFMDFYIIGRMNYETRLGYERIMKGFYVPMLKTVVPLMRTLKYKRKHHDSILDGIKRYFPAIKHYHIRKQLAKNP